MNTVACWQAMAIKPILKDSVFMGPGLRRDDDYCLTKVENARTL